MKAIILAAGKGTRLECEAAELPKAMRLLEGKPLIQYVLDNLDFLEPDDITIVVGFYKEKVMEALGDKYHYVTQQELNGTAKATLCAKPVLGNFSGPVLVCYCDMPFLARETYQAMFDLHENSGAGNTLLAGRVHPIPPFGRLIRNAMGELVDVIEDSACTPEQKLIDEVNIGIQVLDGARMWSWLEAIDDNNPKHEFYLTGVVRVLAEQGVRQEVVTLTNLDEMLGINTMDDMHQAEALLKAKG